MGIEKLLILDLDNTIFETQSIGLEHLEDAFTQFRKLAIYHYSPAIIKIIEKDLWILPFDQVASEHQFPTSLRKQFSKLISETEFSFDIQPFPDFEQISGLNCRKVLVTTGFKHLQQAKIDALDIGSEFEAVYIDEIDAPKRIFKYGIFKKLISESGLDRKDHMVIGDNPASELKAGHELNLLTVQMAKFRQPKSMYADHYITGFEQLRGLISDEERRSF